MSDASAKLKSTPIEKIYTIKKILQIIGAVVLFMTAIFRIAIIIASAAGAEETSEETEVKEYKPHPFAAFTLSLYLIVFGAVLILVEFSLLRARVWFYLLNFSWGKSLFSLFVGLFLIGAPRSVAWFDILMACVFLILSIIFLILHCYHKDAEQNHVDILMDKYDVGPFQRSSNSNEQMNRNNVN